MTTTAIITIIAAVTGFLFYLAILMPEIKEIGWIHDSLVTSCGISKSYAPLKWFRGKSKTPGGALVRSVVPVPAAFLALIDEGLNNQITRHNVEHPTWDKYKNISDYAILIINPMGATVENDPGAPVLFNHSYETAGTCIGVNPVNTAKRHPSWQFWKQWQNRPWIVAPHQVDSNWSHSDFFMHTIWNESEHVREATNDREVFMSYAISGDVHPHVP